MRTVNLQWGSLWPVMFYTVHDNTGTVSAESKGWVCSQKTPTKCQPVIIYGLNQIYTEDEVQFSSTVDAVFNSNAHIQMVFRLKYVWYVSLE